MTNTRIPLFYCREGSIRAFIELYIREDHITVLKAQNNGLTETEILAFIEEDISKEINVSSSETIRNFIEKYDPSVQLEWSSTTIPTTESDVTGRSSFVTPSMTESDRETSFVNHSMAVTDQETFSTTKTPSLMTMTTSMDLDAPASSEIDPIVVGSSGDISHTPATYVSSTDTQNALEPSSIS